MLNHGFHFDNSYATLPPAFFVEQAPVPVAAPSLLLLNERLAQRLGLDVEVLKRHGADWFSGNDLIEGGRPLAQAYAGHQFGFPTMLGDGRAIVLGEQMAPDGKRFDLALKGAGRTPFSRGGDGRAALGPVLREYLVSEAMAALGIATTRSLAVVTTGENVARETLLTGAILTRVASSHLRIGTFQYAAWTRQPELLQRLLDYAITRCYPDLKQAGNPALALLERVMDRQIALVVQWLRVGFIHGVMNTDNVAIDGETIDYGPCAFMDHYDPATVFSSIDERGRYAFGNQPAIALWNLQRFAESLLPLIATDTDKAVAQAEELLGEFTPRFEIARGEMMAAKLGLVDPQPGDDALVSDWLGLLHEQQLDYTNAHRGLLGDALLPQDAFDTPEFQEWRARWQPRHASGGESARRLMQSANPAVIPRNHRVNQALDAAERGDMAPFRALLSVLHAPYELPADTRYCQPPSAEEKVLRTFCGT